MKTLIWMALAWLVTFPIWSQSTSSKEIIVKTHTIRFDDTGLSSNAFLNPRVPFDADHFLVKKTKPDDEEKDPNKIEVLSFRLRNESASRTVLLTIPLQLNRERLITFLYDFDIDLENLRVITGRPEKIRQKLEDDQNRIRDLIPTLLDKTLKPKDKSAALEIFKDLNATNTFLENLEKVKRQLQQEENQESKERPTLKKSYSNEQTLREEVEKVLNSLDNLQEEPKAQAIDPLTDEHFCNSSGKTSVSDLDHYLNIFYLKSKSQRMTLEELRSALCAPGAKDKPLEGAIILQLEPGETLTISPEELLVFHYLSERSPHVKEFKVAFFNELERPANDTGFFKWKSGTERKTEAKLKLTGAIGWSNTPDFKNQLLTVGVDEIDPLDNDRNNNFVGTGTLSLSANLGSRASARVDFRYATGVLGAADSEEEVKTSFYQFNYFTKFGSSFRFGDYAFANPGAGIAISEKGEGGEWIHGIFSVAHIVKRESALGVVADDNRDAEVFIGQLKNLQAHQYATANLIGLWGRDKQQSITAKEYTTVTSLPDNHGYTTEPLPEDVKVTVTQPYEYRTLGGEMFFFFPPDGENGPSIRNVTQSGSIAFFQSERMFDEGIPTIFLRPDDREEDDPMILFEPGDLEQPKDGKGQSWLFRYTFSFLQSRNANKAPTTKASSQIRLALGRGSGGISGNVDEGYLGETNGFAPDLIFLSGGLAASLNKGNPNIRSGLSNKKYYGLSFTKNNFSPIHWVMGFFEGKTKVTSASTTIAVHRYDLVDATIPDDKNLLTDAKPLGYELNLRTNLILPKGIKTQLDAGWFFRGEAVKPLLKDDPWFARILFSVEMAGL